MGEQEVLKTLMGIAQQTEDPEEALNQMVKFLTSNGLSENDATNVAKQVLSQVRGENDEDMEEDDEDRIDYDKCGGKMKKKVAKKACGGKAKKKPKCAKKCQFGGVIENLASTTRMSLINY